MTAAPRRSRYRYLPPIPDASTPRSATPASNSPWPLDVVALCCFALCLRCFTFGRAHWISPDEFFYTLLARDFADVWGGVTHYAEVQRLETLHASGFAWLLSLVFFLSGDQTVETGRWLGLFLNALVAPATYALTRASGYSRTHGLVAGFVLALLPAFWQDADRVWLDHQATLVVTLFWACAIAGWRSSSAKWWALACALLFTVVLTKEYLLLFVALALPFGLIEPIRQRAWRFVGGASLTIVLAGGIAYWLVAGSGWLPSAKYARPWSADAHVQRHERTAPDLQKLYYKNAAESDLPALAWTLALAGVALAALQARRQRERLAAVLTLVVFGGALTLFISMMKQEFGARLLFPAYPILALFVAVALLDVTIPLIPVLVPALAWLCWQRSLRSFIEQTHGAAMFWQIIGAVSALFALAWLATRRGNAPPATAHALAVGATLALLFVMSCGCVTRSLRHQAGLRQQIGAQAGLPELAQRLQRLIGRDAVTLSQNPRELTYFLDMRFAQLDAQAWLDGTIADARRYTTRAELTRRGVQWIVLVRSPDFALPNWSAIRDELRRLPHLAQNLEFAGGAQPSVAVFKVRAATP